MITDFYKKEKICVSKWTMCLLEPLTMAIKEENEDIQSEILINIPSGFYITEYFSKNDFGIKSDEANIIFSYLKQYEVQVKNNFGMSNRQFRMLLARLEVVLINNYAICNWFMKTWKLAWAYVGLLKGL